MVRSRFLFSYIPYIIMVAKVRKKSEINTFLSLFFHFVGLREPVHGHCKAYRVGSNHAAEGK